MKTGREAEVTSRRWGTPKPKPHQKSGTEDTMRPQTETPWTQQGSGQRGKEPGGRRRDITQDNAKHRAHMGTGATEPELALQPWPDRVFSAEEAKGVIKSVLDSELQDSRYQAAGSSQRALELAERVKLGVRALGYERYKLVCHVVLGPVSQSDLCCSSRSVWSSGSDTYAEYLFRNRSLFALCVVYAGYYE
ncbi:hypothetical protein FKM82_021568 [Ascaphus truei]